MDLWKSYQTGAKIIKLRPLMEHRSIKYAGLKRAEAGYLSAVMTGIRSKVKKETELLRQLNEVLL